MRKWMPCEFGYYMEAREDRWEHIIVVPGQKLAMEEK
jgi:hypothetical protein